MVGGSVDWWVVEKMRNNVTNEVHGHTSISMCVNLVVFKTQLKNGGQNMLSSEENKFAKNM